MRKQLTLQQRIKLKKNKRRRLYREITYRDGGEGFIKWCEEHIRINVYVNGIATWVPIGALSTKKNPDTGRSSWMMWEEQKKIAREALKMRNNKFVYRLIVLCWMRGDGKSLFVCLIQIWKFFCFRKQQIMLGANSKDQVKFVHFDIMRDIILNSPRLLRIIGKKNVQEKEIRLRDTMGNVVSVIRSISTASGIVSNITGYTFSEIFDMKSPKFFTQLDGSIRNIPNALGIVDSTVSSKEHVLYGLYQGYMTGRSKTVYFSYRNSPDAVHTDFWNPEMTQLQLDDYETKFPPAEFAMYFRNTWDAGMSRMFTKSQVHACNYIGYNGYIGEYPVIEEKLRDAFEQKSKVETGTHFKFNEQTLLQDLIPTDSIYKLVDERGAPKICSNKELLALSERYDTDFSIMTGVDRSDPMKKNLSHGAKTIVVGIAKGLPGSKSNPGMYANAIDSVNRKYMYFLVHLAHVEMSDIIGIQDELEKINEEFDGIDSLCAERWGMWDIVDWCSEHNIDFEAIMSTYNIQKAYFSELYNVIVTGRFKTPKISVPGNKKTDIFIEEAEVFDHSELSKFYGSPEKKERFGRQDDTMFAIGCAFYGGRYLGLDDFRSRDAREKVFGEKYENYDLVGSY